MGEEVTVREIYEKFKTRFELPDYNSLDKELEISNLDADKFILRSIRNKIKELLEKYADVLEDLLHPDTSIAMLHECSFVNDKLKVKYFELFKRLMYLIRTAEFLDVERSTQKDAKFISFYYSHCEIISRDMKSASKLRMNSWKRELAKDVKVEYFG